MTNRSCVLKVKTLDITNDVEDVNVDWTFINGELKILVYQKKGQTTTKKWVAITTSVRDYKRWM